MKEDWSMQFDNYYDTHLIQDIETNGMWLLVERGFCIPKSDITISAAESFNAVLKRLCKETKCKGFAINPNTLDDVL